MAEGDYITHCCMYVGRWSGECVAVGKLQGWL